MDNKREVAWPTFLFDVFICSLGAYGGPEAHYGVFADQMVTKKKYISEEELAELMALTTILPGPSSTQTIIAIGHKVGGPVLALLTMLVWALPVIIVMTALSFLGEFSDRFNFSQAGFRYIGPMAVGFIVVAAYRIGSKVVKDRFTLSLLFFGAFTTYFVKEAWIFPMVLFIGAALSVMRSESKDIWNKVIIRPPWKYFIAFLVFAFGSLALSLITDNKLVKLFEAFYRYGYLVIGGGQVVVPLMHGELVEVNHYMTSEEFLRGYGIVQGMPGPMFSFSAYAGGMAARGSGTLYQIAGALIGGIGIFLPGVLLIFFVYPIWEDLKKIKAIKISLTGITAVAAGLIVASALGMMQKAGFAWDNLLVFSITVIILLYKKIPAPLIVIFTLMAGFLIL